MPVIDTHVFLTARWRHLAMLNFEVAPATLEPWMPRGVELDFHEGRTYASIVGFQFIDTRVRGIAIPGHRDFEEVNLRFYVRRIEGETIKRGVVFVSEIVPRRAIALVARALYGERYRAMAMRHRIERHDGTIQAEYGWGLKDRGARMLLRAPDNFRTPPAGSLDQFIAEHYWGYARRRGGGTTEYRVEHPVWGVTAASEFVLDADIKALYGQEFVEALSARPASVFLADGSDVIVYRGARLAERVQH